MTTIACSSLWPCLVATPMTHPSQLICIRGRWARVVRYLPSNSYRRFKGGLQPLEPLPFLRLYAFHIHTYTLLRLSAMHPKISPCSYHTIVITQSYRAKEKHEIYQPPMSIVRQENKIIACNLAFPAILML